MVEMSKAAHDGFLKPFQQVVDRLNVKLDKLVEVSERVVVAVNEGTCKSVACKYDIHGFVDIGTEDTCTDGNCAFHQRGYNAPDEKCST